MKKIHKVSILSISLLIIITGSAVSPALGQIKSSFPHVEPDLIKMIVTLPTIILIPFNILSGKLSQKIDYKIILIIGLILYIIGGIGAAFTYHIYFLLIFRGIIGAGMGLLLPLSTSLIGTFYKGEERKQMMGYSNAIANFGSIFASLLAGYIALFNWKYIFAIYLVAIPVFILVLTNLPESPKIENTSNQSNYINGKVILLTLLGFLLNIGFYSIITNIALYLASENLGTSSTAGVATSILTLAGFISGLILNKITKIFNKITVPTFIGLMGVGFSVISLPLYLINIYIGVFLIGFGFGIVKPLLALKVTNVTPIQNHAFSLSIVTSASYLGKFASPIVLRYVRELYCTDSLRFQFIFIGISFFSASIIAIGYGLFKRYILRVRPT